MLFLIVSAVAALNVYTYFTDSGDQDDHPPSYSQSYEPPQPPLCRCDQNWETIDPPRKVDAPVEVDALVEIDAPMEVEAPAASLREQANGEGDLMNLYYQQSKVLKEQGKRHEFIMKTLHAQASASIYEENNWDKPEGEIDLHGLYVKEAIAYSDKAIEEARQRGDSEIRLIVGKGSHSDGGVSKLRPAIQRHLYKDGIPVEVDPENLDVLIVRVDGSLFF